ncbi:MAG: hypothetical protein AAFN16_20525 [Pseudomonadota bacterium]
MTDYPNDQAPDWNGLESKRNDFSEAFPSSVDADTIGRMWDILVAGITMQWDFIREDRHSAKSRTNPEFLKLAEEYSDYLSNTHTDRPFALWTGGIAVSLYARVKRGYTTLENTVLGSALDTIKLHETCVPWDCIGPLWNSISRMFVSKMKGQSVYLFMRTHAPLSIFYRQELTQLAGLAAIPRTPVDDNPEARTTMRKLLAGLEELKPNDSASPGLFFVALYAERNDPTPDEFREINEKGELVARHTFLGERDAVAAIKKFHVRKILDRNNPYWALAKMRTQEERDLFEKNDGVWSWSTPKPGWWDEMARAWQVSKTAPYSVAASEMKLD